jgi:hypothetical protein
VVDVVVCAEGLEGVVVLGKDIIVTGGIVVVGALGSRLVIIILEVLVEVSPTICCVCVMAVGLLLKHWNAHVECSSVQSLLQGYWLQHFFFLYGI